MPYDAAFYAAQSGGSLASARVVLPLVRELVPGIRSVCDAGCGAGTWLLAWQELGVEDVLGLDGDYALRSLRIEPARFRATDLSRPFEAGRGFDLAMSLEVAEHLPPERGPGFVADLVRLAPVVLFSAAVPHQGGTEHVNERWQEDWAAEFARHGYRACDLLRPRLWDDRRVEVWYRQNLLLFASEAALAAHPGLSAPARFPLSVVHPEMFGGGVRPGDKGQLVKLLYWALRRDTARLLRRVRG
jgi:SAM-dependent methyltransferase